MFRRGQSIQVKASSSMLTNNLAVTLNSSSSAADLVYVHKSVAHLLLSSGEPGAYDHKHVICKIPTVDQQMSFVMILQASWVETAGRKILILATQKGIKMYEADGSTLLHWHGFGTQGGNVLFTRGICSVGGNSILIGTSSGQILVFSVSARGGNVSFEEYLSGHDYSLTCVVSRGDNVVSADEHGSIMITKHMDGASFKMALKIKGDGNPCNSLGIWKNLLIAGYSTGVVKFFDISSGVLLGDIAAHSRAITALHVAQGTGLCVTASEDSFVRVWELKAGPTLEVSHLFSENITDCQLVGASFLNNEGRSFAVTAYDSQEIFTFHRQ